MRQRRVTPLRRFAALPLYVLRQGAADMSTLKQHLLRHALFLCCFIMLILIRRVMRCRHCRCSAMLYIRHADFDAVSRYRVDSAMLDAPRYALTRFRATLIACLLRRCVVMRATLCHVSYAAMLYFSLHAVTLFAIDTLTCLRDQPLSHFICRLRYATSLLHVSPLRYCDATPRCYARCCVGRRYAGDMLRR